MTSRDPAQSPQPRIILNRNCSSLLKWIECYIDWWVG